MSNANSQPAPAHLRGADLERWRLDNALTKTEAADAFGLRRSAWDELVGPARAQEVIADPTVAMLLYLYCARPDASPVSPPPDVRAFYDFLALEDSPQDREAFAVLIGRSKPSVYRLLTDNGTPGRPVLRWIEALRRLQLTPRQSKALMLEAATRVGAEQGIDDVLRRGWGRGAGLQGDAD